VGDERAETYLRLRAEAELRRVGAELRRLDAAAEDVWADWLRLTPPLATVPDAAEIVVTGPATQARATVPVHPAGS